MSSSMSDFGGLERALTSLGSQIEYPEPVDLRHAVLARIASDVRPQGTRMIPRRPRWQPAIAAGFVLLLVSALLLTALPQARRAVADLLGFDDLKIEVSEEPLPKDLGKDLLLGDLVAADRAIEVVGVLPVADPDEFGRPDGIFRSSEASPMISVVYGRGPGLPETTVRGVSLLITALDGDLYEGFAEKVLHSGEATVRPVTIRGLEGYWVRGDHAFFVYTRTDGVDEVESSRIANNVLVWEEDGVVLRVEGEMSRAEAMSIAEGIELEE